MQTRSRSRGPTRSPLIFVKNAKDSHFSVIDEGSGELVEKLGRGSYPHLAEFHPDGRRAYLSYLTSATIQQVDLNSLEVTDETDEPGKGNVGLEVSRCGRFLFAGSYGPFPEGGGPGVTVFDLRGDGLELLDRLETGSSTTGMRLDPTGDLWVGLKERNEVARIPGRPPFEIAETFEVGRAPHDLYVHREVGLLQVNNAEDSRLHLIDTMRNEIVAEVETARNPHGGGLSLWNGDPKLFVPSREESVLNVVDVERKSAGGAAREVAMESHQAFAEPTRDWRYLLVDAYEGREISIVDAESEEVVARVETGDTPIHPRASSDGSRAYVGSMGEESVAVLDVSPLYDRRPEDVEVSRLIHEVGKEPSGLFRSWEAFR